MLMHPILQNILHMNMRNPLRTPPHHLRRILPHTIKMPQIAIHLQILIPHPLQKLHTLPRPLYQQPRLRFHHQHHPALLRQRQTLPQPRLIPPQPRLSINMPQWPSRLQRNRLRPQLPRHPNHILRMQNPLPHQPHILLNPRRMISIPLGKQRKRIDVRDRQIQPNQLRPQPLDPLLPHLRRIRMWHIRHQLHPRIPQPRNRIHRLFQRRFFISIRRIRQLQHQSTSHLLNHLTI